jgi:hypothetical protein
MNLIFVRLWMIPLGILPFLHVYSIVGVFAVGAGPILCDNLIVYLLLNQPLSPHHEPQKEFWGLISTGNKCTGASLGQHALEGEFVWTLKDRRIDKAWMRACITICYHPWKNKMVMIG